MTDELLTEEYLSRFPTLLHDVLKNNPKHRTRFLNRIKEDYPPVKVYRGIHRNNLLDDDDFICNVEEAKKYGGYYKNIKIEHYAISVNEDPAPIIKSLSIPNVRHPWLGLAEGVMECEHGPADLVGEATHHNWFLYESSIPLMKTKFHITDECKRIIREAEEKKNVQK